MREAEAKVFRSCAARCARDVLATYSVSVELEEGDPCELACEGQVAVFIGFGGAHARGMLTLTAPYALFCSTYPIPGEGGAELDEADVLDWSGEIANQLLGRIKNRLAPSGIELSVSTPKAMRATRMWLTRSARTSVCMLRTPLAGDTPIGIWLDAVLEEGVHLHPHALAEADRIEEGELVLF